MTVELDCAGLPRGVRKQGRLHRLHVAQSRCRGVHFDVDIRHFSLSFQVFPNSCFLFSSCINKEYSYGCFSGGRHCRRVVASLLERFFHSQFLSNVGTLQFNFHQNQCHRCSQDHACDAHWTAFVGFGDNIRYQSTSSVTVRHIHCQSPNLESIFC